MAMALHSDWFLNRITTMLVTVILVGISSMADANPYDLIVNQGGGSGSYEAGTLLNIAADPPPVGQEFDAWIGGGTLLADAGAANTTMTMPARSVTITASFKLVARNFRTFKEVPYLVAQDVSRFADLLHEGNNRVVRIALFGDSQETAPSGGGAVYIPRLNYQAFLHYGNSPETLIEPLISQTPAWLIRSGKSTGTLEALGVKALPHTRIVKLADGTSNNFIATLLNSGENALPGTFLNDQAQAFLATATGAVKAQVFALTQSGSGEVLWQAKPHDNPNVNFFQKTSNSGILGLSLDQSGPKEFKIRSAVTDALDFNGKQYMQLKLSSSVPGKEAAIAGLRFFNEAYHYGLVINDFALGGYQNKHLLAAHYDAGDMYRAYQFDAAILHLGVNDAGKKTSASTFKSETQQVIAMIRGWMNDVDYKIILMGDPDLKTWTATDARRAEFDQFPVMQEEIALADPNVLMINSRRLADDLYDWRLGHPKLNDYLADIVHYAPEGARVLARVEMDALLGILAPPVNTYSLIVNDGEGDGLYTEGSVVDITANSIPAGHEFLAWTGDSGALKNPHAARTIVTMPAVDIEVTATYQVVKAEQSIRLTLPASRNLDDGAFTISATTTSGLTPVLSSLTVGVCTVSGNRVTLLSDGTCTIAADQSGDSRYKAALQVTGSIVINATFTSGLLSSVTLDHNWHHVDRVPLSESAIVITAPPSFHGKQPGVIRVQKPQTGGGFELRFQEWEYLDGIHKKEIVPYMILEKGRHIMSDNSVWEVGTFDLTGTALWLSHPFLQTFAQGIPKLFLTVQTANGLEAVSVRARNVTQTGFEAALFEQEQLMDGHRRETVGYLAIYSRNTSSRIDLGSATLSYHLQQSAVTHQWQTVLNSALKLEEEQSADREVIHKTERVDVLGLGAYLFAQDVSSLDGDSIALRQKPAQTPSILE